MLLLQKAFFGARCLYSAPMQQLRLHEGPEHPSHVAQKRAFAAVQGLQSLRPLIEPPPEADGGHDAHVPSELLQPLSGCRERPLQPAPLSLRQAESNLPAPARAWASSVSSGPV